MSSGSDAVARGGQVASRPFWELHHIGRLQHRDDGAQYRNDPADPDDGTVACASLQALQHSRADSAGILIGAIFAGRGSAVL